MLNYFQEQESHHARHISEVEDPHQSLSHSHRQLCVQTSLVTINYSKFESMLTCSHCFQVHIVGDPADVFCNCHDETICWQSYRLHSHKRKMFCSMFSTHTFTLNDKIRAPSKRRGINTINYKELDILISKCKNRFFKPVR